MANYTFETMGSGQALGYDAPNDTLTFSYMFASASSTFVLFNAATPSSVATITVKTVTAAPRTVLFGVGIGGETVNFQDGSQLYIGTPGGDTVTGAAFADGLYGGAGDDSLNGGGGADVIEGGPGADTLTGGAGPDQFFIRYGDSGLVAGHTDVITDFSSDDILCIAPRGSFVYVETTAASFAAALTLANARVANANQVIAVAVGSDVIVFSDTNNDFIGADDAVVLKGRTLADIDSSNIGPIPNDALPPPAPPPPAPPPAQPGPVLPTEPVLPASPLVTNNTPTVQTTGNMDLIHPGDLVGAFIIEATDHDIHLRDTASDDATPRIDVVVEGTGLTYANNQLVGGTATGVLYLLNGATSSLLQFHANAASFPATFLNNWIATNDAQGALSAILSGADVMWGSSPSPLTHESGADLIRGFAGNDVILGHNGPDTLFGGTGDDVIIADGRTAIPAPDVAPQSTYLRGEEGDDYILGGIGFDDINGNQGNDTIAGGPGDDWVVGGKDNDLQFGDAGNDIVWGNLGNDTLEGGAGNDQIRGGQGDDVLFGDAGADYVSGDRGNDTEVGGAGADIFHSFSGAGIDQVLDFSVAEGDRVMLDPGTQFTVSQVGSDTVIDMGGGDRVILVGVQMSTLPPGTIFLG